MQQDTSTVAEPAKVETQKVVTEIPLPPKSVITIVDATPETPRTTTVTIPAASVYRDTSQNEAVTTPQGHKPPSVTDVAAADGVTKSYYMAGALVLAALALFYFGHGKAGGIAMLGAVLVPALARFVSNEAATRTLFLIVGIAGAIYVSWYLLKPKIKLAASLPPDSPLAKSLADE